MPRCFLALDKGSTNSRGVAAYRVRRWAGPPFFHHRRGPSSIRGTDAFSGGVDQHPLGYPSHPSHSVGFL